MDDHSITLAELVAVILTHFEENLITDDKVLYTEDEILEQLSATGVKVYEVLVEGGYDLDGPAQVLPKLNFN